MKKEDYIFLNKIIKHKGICHKTNVTADCKTCLLRTETNPECHQDKAADEAYELLESLSQEELFEMLL